MISWHSITSEVYNSTPESLKTDDKLFFLSDTGEIYKGKYLYSKSVEFYENEIPTNPTINRIYIEKNTLEGRIFDGDEWVIIAQPVQISIDVLNTTKPVSGFAVYDYVNKNFVKYSESQKLTTEEQSQVRQNLRFIGKNVEGQQFTINDEIVTAGSNAEILGDYESNIAVGQWSIAEGRETVVKGSASHVEGRHTIATGSAQHVEGVANIEDIEDKYIHIAGNGTSPTDRSNAHTLDRNGNAWYSGDVYVGSTCGTNKDDDSKKLATEDYVNTLYMKLNSNTVLGFYCIEDVTIVINGVSKVYEANSNVEITFIEGDVFEIIPTSDNSILSLTAFPGALGTYYPWLEGVRQFSNILFDMNAEEFYSKWSQGNQGSYQVQFAQYTNCIFWSDNPYVADVNKRTNYTLYYTAQLPLCYSNIPDNTFKAFFLAFGVSNDPNWGNPVYRDSFAKAGWATQAFSYYGARTVGIFGHDSPLFNIVLPKDCRGLMCESTAIENAGTFDAVNVTNFGAKSGSWRDAFRLCTSLKNLYIKNLKVSINVSWSPINYNSIYYIISEAANTNKITISVSPYTYNLLGPSDFELAASKNITIELITTNYVEDRRLGNIANKTDKDYVDNNFAKSVFTITINENYVPDKTFEEAVAAHNNNQALQVIWNNGIYIAPLALYAPDDGYMIFSTFTCETDEDQFVWPKGNSVVFNSDNTVKINIANLLTETNSELETSSQNVIEAINEVNSNVNNLGENVWEKVEGENGIRLKGTGGIANGEFAIAMGEACEASGVGAVAAGSHTKASGNVSATFGQYTQTTDDGELAAGTYNKSTKSDDPSIQTAFSFGNGTSDTNRSNAFEIKKNGDIYIGEIKLEELIEQKVAEVLATLNEAE